ncbi:MAG: hypothetical protein Fur0028_01300 [Bacteroidales bacterium]
MDFICPIHKTTECVKQKKTFSTGHLMKLYKKYYNIDTTQYFETLEEISLYICKRTKYCFFQPKRITGDKLFYEQLLKQNQYYLPWKWENEQALHWISEKDSVLEIACGNGNFLKKASKKAAVCIGLDLMADSFKEENIEIIKEDYLSFFKTNTDKFDVIVSFQFLEHIYDIDEFFQFIISLLKPNGKLILGVPDNESILIKKEEVLNFPPHHMGMWTKKSLKMVGESYGFKTIFSKTEPLQPHFVNRRIYMKELQRIEKLGYIGKILNKLFHRISLFLYINLPTLFKGHSFIIVMVKK